MFAQIAKMTRHHGDVGAPVFKADKHAHANLVHSGLPHAVEAVDAPLEVGFLPGRMVYLISLAVVCLLKAHHAVESGMCEALIILGRERHYLHSEVVEIGAAHTQGILYIISTGSDGVLTGDNEQVLERAEAAYGLALVFDLLRLEDHALESIVAVKAAIDTRVGA